MTSIVNPPSPQLLDQLETLTPTQLAWLSGYCWSRCNPVDGAAQPAQAAAPQGAAAAAVEARRVTIISASQTGNARRVAEQLLARLKGASIEARLTSASDFKSKTLPDEDIVLLVTSTQGEGEPPEEAFPLHKFLFGKKAPRLDKLSFAVLGLGDSSYPEFCKAGRDFDAQLAALGATRLHDRGDCDLDFQATATAWIDSAAETLGKLITTSASTAAPASSSAQAAPEAAASNTYTREAPYTATLSVRQKITSREAGKDIEHIEIDLGDSGLRYQPGDALGVWPVNAPALVGEFLNLNGLSGEEEVRLKDGTQLSVREALTHHLDITQTTRGFVQGYAALSQDEKLQALLADAKALDAWLENTPPVGVLAEHPHALGAQALVDLLRPQTPRLYSIASAQDEVGDEVHLTVGVVQYEHHGNHYTGAASGYLGQLLEEDDPVRVFVEPNPNFRLPADGAKPIIMIGAGTGVAPYRAFMQQRDANGDTGNNWLIFGNQKFTNDFLYQAEWLDWRKNGLLTRASLAWSRQQKEKVYVQHRIREEGAELWKWLQAGAHVYVCGDGARMGRDVEQALLDVIATHGGMDADAADDYLNELREDRRYQRDVY